MNFCNPSTGTQPEQSDDITSSGDSSPNVSLTPIRKRKSDQRQVCDPQSPISSKKKKKKKLAGWKRDYNALRANCKKLIPSTTHLTVAILFVADYGTIQGLAAIREATLIAIQNSALANVNRLEDTNREAFDLLKDQKDFVIDVGVKQNILDLANEARKYLNLSE